MTESYDQVLNLPIEIQALNNWVTWQLTFQPGRPKPAKVPYYTNGKMRQGEQGSPADVAQLTSFEQALESAKADRRSGIGLAVLPDCGYTALDFDDCVQDRKIMRPDIAALVFGTYCEYSPSGTGLRALFKGHLPSRKDSKPAGDRFKIEFFGDSGFVTVTGDVTDDCLMFGFEDAVADITPEVRALFVERFGEPVVPVANGALTEVDDDVAFLLSLKPTLGWTIEQASDILEDCDAGCGREDWLYVGMALHFEFGGSKAALELYNTWSAKGGNYGGRKDVDGRWRSFGKPGKPNTITGQWLLKWAKPFKERKAIKSVANWRTKLKECKDEYELRHVMCKQIVADPLVTDMDREALANDLCAALKSIGTKLTLKTCRELLTPEKVVVELPAVYDPQRPVHYDDSHCPDWLKGFVYIGADDVFFKIDTDVKLTRNGFNANFNRFMPRDENDMVIVSAHTMALEHYRIPAVHRGVYMPKCGPLFNDMGTGQVSSLNVNTYSPLSVPEAAKTYTPDGLRVIELFKKHIMLFCGQREREATLLMCWLAHNVQKPGVKIRWSILLKGIEGDGKSVIGDLMRSVMGTLNVKSVSPTVLAKDFNGWSEGSCLAIIEELRIAGHNRHDTANRLKPLITNDTVEIHRKGKDSYEVWNTQNYISFTNFSDALPLTDTDRRYMIIFSPFTTKEDLENATGGNGKYFTELHNALHAHYRAVRKFLLEYEIDYTLFHPNGQAPESNEKLTMIQMGISDEQALVKECIEQGGVGISKAVVLSSYVRTAANFADSELNITNYEFKRIMERLGWTRLPTRVKWNGKTEILWHYGNVGNWEQKMRPILDATLPGGAPDSEKFLTLSALF